MKLSDYTLPEKQSYSEINKTLFVSRAAMPNLGRVYRVLEVGPLGH